MFGWKLFLVLFEVLKHEQAELLWCACICYNPICNFKTGQPVLKPVNRFWNRKRTHQKSLNGYGHKNLSTPMWWCSCKSLNSFGSLNKSDYSDFMDASNAVVQQRNTDGGKVWEEYIKKKFRLNRSAAPVVSFMLPLVKKLRTVWKTLNYFLRSLVTMRRRNFAYLKYHL